MKWVGMPIRFRWVKMCSEMRLLSTPLPSTTSCFFLLKAVASSLKNWISVPGSGPFIKDLGLAFVNAAA